MRNTLSESKRFSVARVHRKYSLSIELIFLDFRFFIRFDARTIEAGGTPTRCLFEKRASRSGRRHKRCERNPFAAAVRRRRRRRRRDRYCVGAGSLQSPDLSVACITLFALRTFFFVWNFTFLSFPTWWGRRPRRSSSLLFHAGLHDHL